MKTIRQQCAAESRVTLKFSACQVGRLEDNQTPNWRLTIPQSYLALWTFEPGRAPKGNKLRRITIPPLKVFSFRGGDVGRYVTQQLNRVSGDCRRLTDVVTGNGAKMDEHFCGRTTTWLSSLGRRRSELGRGTRGTELIFIVIAGLMYSHKLTGDVARRLHRGGLAVTNKTRRTNVVTGGRIV